MKAVQIKTPGGPEVLTPEDFPVPEPKAGELLVKMVLSGVNFIDIYQREGRYKVPLPFVLGQEGAGTVAGLGGEVSGFSIGDRVTWTGVMGSYAEYIAIPADRAVHIPHGLTDQQATAAMLQGMTAHYLTHDTYHLKDGDTILVHAAAGGVGLLLVQMAHRLGARIIATVSTEEKAALARQAGADEVVIYSQVDFEGEVKRFTSGKGLRVVYDSVGKTTFEKGLNLLQPRGLMVLYGGSSGNVAPLDLMRLSSKGSLFVTRPTLAHHIATREELVARSKSVFSMITSGMLKIRVGNTYPLAEAASAHRDLEQRKTTGKLLLLP
jgi:NADPH:quinone reductase